MNERIAARVPNTIFVHSSIAEARVSHMSPAGLSAARWDDGQKKGYESTERQAVRQTDRQRSRHTRHTHQQQQQQHRQASQEGPGWSPARAGRSAVHDRKMIPRSISEIRQREKRERPRRIHRTRKR
mmetsp:Transcript_28308/g.70717  ORF Transcript_28308/g.70717 Transcript_28308/m.70717 type:complete len:127 (-) Transcript_28308:651-1031(-)